MPFNSLSFLIFITFTASSYAVITRWDFKKYCLLVASYVFYAACEPIYVAILIFTTVVDWFIAQKIEKANTQRKRMLFLGVTLIMNLGLLAYFKYSEFLFLYLMPGFPFREIILPVGISFYTFQTLSYTLDVYRKDIKADAKLLDFALFVAFFPQLVAGPIVRAKAFLPQLNHARRISFSRVATGISFFIFGVFQKVVLADSLLAPIADIAFANPAQLSSLDAISGMLAFSLQIFFDFCGYSTCAIGLASCFGFRLPQNFSAPYAAQGFSDFWRRWHISLSSWFRDYLYIPLGGSQKGTSRTFLNLMCTMGLAGLWHGASWLFVIWGLLHGLLLVLEHTLKQAYIDLNWKTPLWTRGGWQLLTFIMVSLLWVFFRSNSFANAMTYFEALFDYTKLDWVSETESVLGTVDHKALFALVLGVLIWHSCTRYRPLSYYFVRWPYWFRAFCLSIMLILIIYQTGGDNRAFIYFQF